MDESKALSRLHELGIDGKGVHVAILDSGFSTMNLPFRDRIEGGPVHCTTPNIHYMNAINLHGSLVASIVNTIAPNCILKDLTLYPPQATHDALIFGLSQCIDYCRRTDENTALIVNISLVTHHMHCAGLCPCCRYVDRLWDEGAFVVVAAGNKGEDKPDMDGKFTIVCPANAKKVFVVGEGDFSGVKKYSGGGPTIDNRIKPDLIAKIAVKAKNEYSFNIYDHEVHFAIDNIPKCGTSFSTPVITGASALLAQIHPDWNNEDIKKFFTENVKRLEGVPDYRQGKGVAMFWDALVEEGEDCR